MKTIIRIAKTELSMMFYSPIAWLLSIVFLFQCALTYTKLIDPWLIRQELGGVYLKGMKYLTSYIFATFPDGFFLDVFKKVYLYLPLLTMGLISRELSSGTIKLLFSSPVKLREIVYGKFLAMAMYSLVMVLIAGVFVIYGLFNIRTVDYGMLLSGLFGLFLLLSAYSAIGLFMSSLTSYQVVAGVSTLVMFAVLSYIGLVWQDIDFVRDLTYFLSISGRAEKMVAGLVTTRDVLYFLIIIFLFLSLTLYKLKGGRESTPGFVKAGRYTAIVICAVLLGYVTSRPGLIGYLDTTADKLRTLTPNSQRIIKEMGNEPLEVTTYVNLLDRYYWNGSPSERNNDLDRWERYVRFKPDIKFKYVYYYDSAYSNSGYNLASGPDSGKTADEIAKKYAKSWKVDLREFKTPSEIRKQIDLIPELNRYVMQLKYKDKTTFLRLYDDMAIYPSETETSAALKRLMQAKMPKIGFLEGHLERNINKLADRDYKILTSEITFRHALINQGFDIETVNLEKREIPSDIAALVIADPKVDFDTATLHKIIKYIADGGNLLIAGEPGKQSVLNPLLQVLGVQLREGILLQQSKDFALNMSLLSATDTAAGFSKPLAYAVADSQKVCMPGATALSYNGNSPFRIQPLLLTDPQSGWLRKGKLILDSAAVTYSAANGDEKGAMPTAVSLTRNINGKEQRIIVTGDADFMSTAELGRTTVLTANFYFNTALFSWLCYKEFPIDTFRPDPKDNRLNLTDGGLTAMRIFTLGIMPGLLLISGSVLLIRRKRK